jgi:endogenous inhibitor of DNA gyrase (YacG/DUF329 family)
MNVQKLTCGFWSQRWAPRGGMTPGGRCFNEEKCVTSPKETRCPQCRKQTSWEGNPSRPFCSERCKLIDLGAWVSEDYRIAGEKKVGDDEEPD